MTIIYYFGEKKKKKNNIDNGSQFSFSSGKIRT